MVRGGFGLLILALLLLTPGCEKFKEVTGETGEGEVTARPVAPSVARSTPEVEEPVRDFLREMYLDPSQATIAEPRSELVWLETFGEGRKLAKEQNRPLLVLVRCPAGTQSGTLDEVLLSPPFPLADKLRQFVTVVLTDADGVDLARLPIPEFQDPDQTWWLWALSPEGNIYSNQGNHLRNATDQLTEPQLTAWMDRVLEHHYDARRTDWKVEGDAVPEQTPVELITSNPGFAEWTARAETLGYLKSPGQCVCCHQVQDAMWMEAEQKHLYERGRDSWIWPSYGSLGIQFDPGNSLVITEVTPNSIAAEVGLQPGDRLCQLDDRRLFSETDFRGFLQRFWKYPRRMEFVAVRDDDYFKGFITLRNNQWRRYPVVWRPTLRESVLATHPGIIPKPAKESFRKQMSLPPGLAISPEVGPASPAWQQGVRTDQVILEIGGIEDNFTPREFLTMYSILADPGELVLIRVFDIPGERMRTLRLKAVSVLDLPPEVRDAALLRNK